MALDTSGSIGDDTARKFITLARSIPRDNIHLEVITFTDSVMPLDLDNPRFQSGGTSFSPIENYIRSTVMPKYKNKYPSSVVVITDGDASFYGAKPEDKHKDNWFWLLDGYYLRSSHLFGKIKTLKEYIN
jgi:predicted metal-dependent peptidase